MSADAPATQVPEAPRRLEVSDPRAAELLLDWRKSRHLHPFLGRACTPSEAARELDCSKSHMSYWVTRLLQLGLIRKQARPGRTDSRRPLYRAVADHFVVPSDLLPAQSLDALFAVRAGQWWWHRLKHNLEVAVRRRESAWHMHVFRREAGVFMQVAPVAPAQPTETPLGGPPQHNDLVNQWARLHLQAAQQVRLCNEIEALLDKYRRLSRPGQGQAVLVHLAAIDDAG